MRKLLILVFFLLFGSSCSKNPSQPSSPNTTTLNLPILEMPVTTLPIQQDAILNKVHIEINRTPKVEKVNLKSLLSLNAGESILVKDIDEYLIYFLIQTETKMGTKSKGIYVFDLQTKESSTIYEFPADVYVIDFNVHQDAIFYQSYDQDRIMIQMHSSQKDKDMVLYETKPSYILRNAQFFEYQGSILTVVFDSDEQSFCDLIFYGESVLYETCGAVQQNRKLEKALSNMTIQDTLVAIKRYDEANQMSELLILDRNGNAVVEMPVEDFASYNEDLRSVLISAPNNDGSCSNTLYQIDTRDVATFDFDECLMAAAGFDGKRVAGYTYASKRNKSGAELIPVIFDYNQLLIIEEIYRNEKLPCKGKFLAGKDDIVAVFYEDSGTLYLIQ